MIGRNNIRIMQHSEDLTEPPRNKNVHPYQCCPMFQTRRTNNDPIMDCFFASMPISDWKIRLCLKSVSVVGRRCSWSK